MTESGAANPPDPVAQDPFAQARDWITLWQSELTALATDREAQETWQKLVALWAEAAGAAFGARSPAARNPDHHERTDGGAGAAVAPRAAPVAAAPDPRDAEIARLRARVDGLEQRLGELERERPPAAPSAAGRRRGRPKHA